MITTFKILVYLGTIPFIAFWLWVGIKALRGKLTMKINFLGNKVESRWSIVLVSAILIVKNSLILSSTAAIDSIAIMLMEKYHDILTLWSEIIREVGRFNQPWFWGYAPTSILGIDGWGFFYDFFVTLCLLMRIYGCRKSLFLW